MGSLFSGPIFLLTGLRLITHAGIRGYVVIPLLINIVLFVGGFWLLYAQMDGWIEQLLAWLMPTWLEWLRVVIEPVIWTLSVAVALIVLFFGLTIVAGIVAAPFYSLLAQAVEHHYKGIVTTDENSRPVWKEIPHLVMEEVRKLRYYLVRALPLLILFVIPGVNIIAAPIWIAFTGWMMALQYIAYPLDNHGTPFAEQYDVIKRKRIGSFSLGLSILFVTTIPIINFLILPVAVAGATAFWVKKLDQQEVAKQ